MIIICGITGFINFKENISNYKQTVEKMTNSLKKRGPDQYGYYISKNVLLGHRRLIVIDPSGGIQPMSKTFNNNCYTIIYNGELYNTQNLRRELIKEGFTFDSYSDTEVLLTSYIAWGSSCVKKLNGIFAFAIFNKMKKSIFLSRDPLGVKPLYYTLTDNNFIFGSELKALLSHPFVEPILDESGICEIMGLGPAHTPNNGIFKNIHQLPPAHSLTYSADNKVKLEEYWKLTDEPHTESETDTAEHIRSLLLDSIKGQLVSDVPICTFLSGGLDSSIITAVAAEEFKKNGSTLKTFSVDYEGNNENFMSNSFQPSSDDEWIDKMVAFSKTNHRKVILNNNELVTSLDEATFANDCPGMADIDSSLLLFCKEIRKKAVVALSGECADEIFGGYPWYTKPEMFNSNTFPWSNSVTERQGILSHDLKNINLSSYVQQAYDDTIKSMPCYSGNINEIDPLKKLFYLNIKWFMNTLLTRKDRMSMHNSLEVRVPFADIRLVQYAYNIPNDLKFYNNREKGLLRKALTGLLPNDVLWRKKSPYPKTFSPEYTKGVQDRMNKILDDESSPILQLIDKPTVKNIVESGGKSFGKPWFGQLMRGPQLIAYLIQVDLWLKKNKVKVVP